MEEHVGILSRLNLNHLRSINILYSDWCSNKVFTAEQFNCNDELSRSFLELSKMGVIEQVGDGSYIYRNDLYAFVSRMVMKVEDSIEDADELSVQELFYHYMLQGDSKPLLEA